MVHHLCRTFVLLAFALLGQACVTAAQSSRTPDKLYFAIRLEQDGRPVATPRLLGFEGKKVLAEKWSPGEASPDYRLLLQPKEQGLGYGISFDLELPSGRSSRTVGLAHGEERTFTLDDHTKVTLMVMRVNSPEFRALMSTPVRSSEPGTI